jgi:hypothetical protein
MVHLYELPGFYVEVFVDNCTTAHKSLIYNTRFIASVPYGLSIKINLKKSLETLGMEYPQGRWIEWKIGSSHYRRRRQPKIPSVGDRLSILTVMNHFCGKKSVPYGWNLFRSDS